MSPSALLNEKDYGDVSLSLLEMVSAEIEGLRLTEQKLLQQQQQQQQQREQDDQQQDESSPPQPRRAQHVVTTPIYHSFPPACWTLLQKIDGNTRCIDCGEHDPQWAAVSYGALMCLQCSGHHRSLGVTVSLVRSVSMDEWSIEQVVAMLEGGNQQLRNFFSRHALTKDACPGSATSSPARSRSSSPSGSPASTNENEQNTPSPAKKVITSENVLRLRYKTKAALFYRQQLQLHVTRVLEAGPYRGREMSRAMKHNQPVERRNSTE